MSFAKPTNGSNADYAARIGAVFDSINNGNYPFPAVQVPSADPNTLDDYEEGTFTPNYTAGSGTPTSVTTGNARYTKWGREIFAKVDFTITNAGSAASTLFVNALPFASTVDVSNASPAHGCNVTSGAADGGFLSSASAMALFKYDGTTIWAAGNRHTAALIYA